MSYPGIIYHEDVSSFFQVPMWVRSHVAVLEKLMRLESTGEISRRRVFPILTQVTYV